MGKPSETKHLLAILRQHIVSADFCIFDISTWNPNVALEIGMAEGMGAEYYVVVNRKLSSGVPADIQGIQRIEYRTYNDFDGQRGLFPLLVKYLVNEHTHPRSIWEALESDPKRERKYYLALRILAHFRDNKRLTDYQLRNLAHGTDLRRPDTRQLVERLYDMGLLSNITRKAVATLRKRLFRDPVS
jgi:hypothetical protein